MNANGSAHKPRSSFNILECSFCLAHESGRSKSAKEDWPRLVTLLEDLKRAVPALGDRPGVSDSTSTLARADSAILRRLGRTKARPAAAIV